MVAIDLGCFLSKNHGASCWDKKVRAKSVPNLSRAAALAPLEILKKVSSAKSLGPVFLNDQGAGPEIEKRVFPKLAKNGLRAPFYAHFC